MRLLLLAGTSEARQLAQALGRRRDLPVLASLTRADRTPRALGVPTRIGAFGGPDAFGDFLDREGIGAVLDASHPFEADQSALASRGAESVSVPYLQILRPSWRPGPGDDWRFAHHMGDVPRHLPLGVPILIDAGAPSVEDLDALAMSLAGRQVWVRGGTGRFAFQRGGWIADRPQGGMGEEVALLSRLGVGCLVTRNAGGITGRSRVDAAGHLGLPVVMIRRPPRPEAPRVDTVSAALTWLWRHV